MIPTFIVEQNYISILINSKYIYTQMLYLYITVDNLVSMSIPMMSISILTMIIQHLCKV